MAQPQQPPPGEYADALSQIIDRDAELRERARRPAPPRTSSSVGMGAVAVLAVVLAVVWAGAFRRMSAPPPPLNPVDTELNTRITAFAVAQQVRQFEEEHGRPPVSLDELGLTDTGLTLVVEADGWRVEKVLDTEVVTADSRDDPQAVILEMVEEGGAAPRDGGMR